MIRKLVAALLLVNVVFFAWMQWGRELTGGGQLAQPQAALNADKIKLLNQPEPHPAPVPPVAASAVVPVPLPASAPAVPETQANPAPAAAVPETAQKETAQKGPAPKEAAHTSVTAAPAKNREAACLEWGEFSGTDLARAEKALAGLKLGEKMDRRTVEYDHGYLVYLAPFKTAAGHAKKVRELKAAGVSDFFVIKEAGRLKNAISLGVFKTEEAARHYRKELSKKGLKSIEVGPRAARLKFIIFTLKQVDKSAAKQIVEWQKDYPGSEVKTLTCPEGGK